MHENADRERTISALVRAGPEECGGDSLKEALNCRIVKRDTQNGGKKSVYNSGEQTGLRHS